MKTLTCIGVGNMGAAILTAVLRKGLYRADALVLCDAFPDKCAPFVAQGAYYTADAAEATEKGDVVLIAVKPQNLSELAQTVGGKGAVKLVLSICAGVPIAVLETKFPGAHIVRIMPNTPLMVGAGASGIAYGTNVTDAEKEAARAIFAAGGTVTDLPEERLDALTALTSSSIAYFAQMIGDMAAWAAKNGFDETEAVALAAQAAAGTCAILAQTKHTPESLRIAVTSPHGTTEAALKVLKEADAGGTLARAMDACRDRAAELAAAQK